MVEHTKLEQAAELLCQAHYAVALTGAGISTPSGIPDFRTPGKGLWESVDSMEVASIYSFRRDPKAFYDWMHPHLDVMLNAQPNPAHLALAELEATGKIKAVITQNIDGLHQAAGSRQVFELHGHLRSLTCLDCFKNWPADGALTALEQNRIPSCPDCDGVLKPDAILFGEQLPIDVLNGALEHARQADLILVIGSSLTIVPAAHVPDMVHANGGQIIIFNYQPTHTDPLAAAIFRDDVAESLPRLAQACL